MATLLEAAQSGNHRAALVCLRDKLAQQISVCESPRDLPALSKRFMDVLDELDKLPEDRDTPLRRAQKRTAQERPVKA